MQPFRSLILFVVLAALSICLSAETPSAEGGFREEINQQVKTRRIDIGRDYMSVLIGMRDTFQKQGDLKATLAVREEFSRFAGTETIPESALVDVPQALRELQTRFMAKLDAVEGEVVAATLVALQAEIRNLTKGGDLDAAIKLQSRAEAISKFYGVSEPIEGKDLIVPAVLPTEIQIVTPHDIPVKMDGEVVGSLRLNPGERYPLKAVEGKLLVVQVGRSDYRVPIVVTNFVDEVAKASKRAEDGPVASTRGLQAARGFRIVKATYGVDSRIVDVTERLRSAVKDGLLVERSGTHLCGRDPAFGVVKETRITYLLDGHEHTAIFREGDPIRLP